jgi:hypothetical protein
MTRFHRKPAPQLRSTTANRERPSGGCGAQRNQSIGRASRGDEHVGMMGSINGGKSKKVGTQWALEPIVRLCQAP